jgi:hypothetical protein
MGVRRDVSRLYGNDDHCDEHDVSRFYGNDDHWGERGAMHCTAMMIIAGVGCGVSHGGETRRIASLRQ